MDRKPKARRRGRKIEYTDIGLIASALNKLHNARTLLRGAAANHAAARVARAIKSANGAFNHAHRMWEARVREEGRHG